MKKKFEFPELTFTDFESEESFTVSGLLVKEGTVGSESTKLFSEIERIFLN